MNKAAPRVPLIAILNPNSGPGTSVDANYTNAVNSLRAAGGTVIGYVYTSYGARSIAAVEQDIDRYHSFYSIDGIMFDEMANTSAETNLAYYAQLYSYVKGVSTNWLVMGNPGINTLEAYLTRPCADILITYEDNTGYPTYVPDAWTQNHSPTNFAHLCHTVTNAATMTNYVQLALSRNVGWIYVTDDKLSNPWDTLATYWTNEVNYIVQTNRARLIIRATSPQSLELQVKGIPGRYVTQVSINFTNWQPAATNSTPDGNLTVPLNTQTNVPAQFYRMQQFVR